MVRIQVGSIAPGTVLRLMAIVGAFAGGVVGAFGVLFGLGDWLTTGRPDEGVWSASAFGWQARGFYAGLAGLALGPVAGALTGLTGFLVGVIPFNEWVRRRGFLLDVEVREELPAPGFTPAAETDA